MITKFSKGGTIQHICKYRKFELGYMPYKKRQNKFKNKFKKKSTGGIAFQHQARILTWKLMR